MDNNKKNCDCQFSVYAIWCKITDKYYVGVTRQKTTTRIRQHKRGKKQLIDKEIQKIGWEGNWDWWTLEEHIPAENIDEREKYWIDCFDCVNPKGYNKTHGGIGNTEMSEETRAQMHRSHIGKKCAPFTEEHKANISKSRTGEKNPFYGKPAWNRGIPCTEQAKIKIRKKLTGRKRPDQSERMKGANNPNFGKPKTAEQKAKIGAANRGKTAWNKGIPRSEDTKEKISKATRGRNAWNKGIPCSEKAKANLREKALERDLSGERNPFYGKKHTPETKAILREKALARVAAKKAKKEKAAAQENIAAQENADNQITP